MLKPMQKEEVTPKQQEQRSDTHPVLQNPARSADGPGVMETAWDRREQRTLHAGVMHPCYTKWSEYYKRTKRRV